MSFVKLNPLGDPNFSLLVGGHEAVFDVLSVDDKSPAPGVFNCPVSSSESAVTLVCSAIAALVDDIVGVG